MASIGEAAAQKDAVATDRRAALDAQPPSSLLPCHTRAGSELFVPAPAVNAATGQSPREGRPAAAVARPAEHPLLPFVYSAAAGATGTVLSHPFDTLSVFRATGRALPRNPLAYYRGPSTLLPSSGSSQ